MIAVTVQQMVFEADELLKKMASANQRILSRFGAFVRQRGKTSIRPRKAPSQPGAPPSSHVGLLRDYIVFQVEPGNVIIGPMQLNAKVSATSLRALEHGGQSLILRYAWQNGRRVVKDKRVITVQARPSMQPAFEAELQKVPKLWENALAA